ncbi:MAG: YdeI/OmpD-associated family protein [Gaiellaceae bacterium]
MSALDELELLEPNDRDEWRAWLEGNHAEASRVWLAIGKKGGARTSLSYEQAVEEALCFGWIDGIVQRLDDERFRQLFARRKERSTWSRSNKERVARLEAEGRMRPAGLAAVETAKANGSWTVLDEVEDLVVPDDLAAALRSRPAALRNFEAFPPSARKAFLYWVAGVKSPLKRAERIAETARMASENRRLGGEVPLRRPTQP